MSQDMIMNPNATILIVDDEELVLKSLRRELASLEGVRLLMAGSGPEALALLRLQPVQVVLTDHRMPEMSGVELLEEVKKISPETTRMMMTGFADLSTAMAAINKGEIFRFIVKPWKHDELLKALSEALDRAASPPGDQS